jgi:fructose-bisphosphate aldolase/2-amino-3,7-dideoxy-D-threo-hept-6-ulosonate synthase
MVKNAVDVGGAGVAIGRNVFQAESPRKTTRAITEIVHNDAEVDDALKILQG